MKSTSCHRDRSSCHWEIETPQTSSGNPPNPYGHGWILFPGTIIIYALPFISVMLTFHFMAMPIVAGAYGEACDGNSDDDDVNCIDHLGTIAAKKRRKAWPFYFRVLP